MMRFFLLVIIFCSCVNSNTDPSSNKVSREDSLPASAPPIIVSDKEINEGKLYQYLNDSINQKILIQAKGDNKIIFQYVIHNKKSNCSDSIKGLAINKHPDEDPELDEDEDGFGYPSLEYIYEQGKYYLAIRVAMTTEDKVILRAAGFSTNGCNYESIGILKQVTNK